MKLVDADSADKYLFLGGKISPKTLFADFHIYAYAAVGPEIVKIFFDNSLEAARAEKLLKTIGTENIAQITREENVLNVWPKYIKNSPLETPDRKYKIAYKLLNALSIIGELYYNEETGEIYIDEFADEETVKKIVEHYEQRVFVVADKEREYTSLSAVDYVTKRQGE